MFKLIIGNMYSGKSNMLIELLDRYHIGKKQVILIRPKLDKRNYISRSKNIKYEYDIKIIDTLNIDTNKYDVIGIDELQFFDKDILYDFIVKCLNNKKIIIGSGLLATSELNVFESINKILPLATDIEKLNAVCQICGENASYTYCKQNKTNDIQLDDGNMYEARCWECYNEIDSVELFSKIIKRKMILNIYKMI